MKKLFLLSALITLTFNSCGQDDEAIQMNEKNISINKGLSNKFISFIKTKINVNSKTSLESFDKNIYDFEHVYYNKEVNAYYVLQKDFNFDSDQEQMALYSTPNKMGEFEEELEIGMTKTDDKKYEIKYYFESDLLYSVDYIFEKDKLMFANGHGNENSILGRKSCGQGTIDCMQGAYSHHGWMSVALVIETAFIPETAVALAGACAIKNCLH